MRIGMEMRGVVFLRYSHGPRWAATIPREHSVPMIAKIAVIGGGVAGMSAAWHLYYLGFDVKVFEKAGHIGGNARTIDVVVGDETRWVDLGVNDFNSGTYVCLVRVLDELGVKYRPIEDTACFYTLDGSLMYTSDWRSNTAAPEAIKRDAVRFRLEAPEVLTSPGYRYASVKDYVTEKRYSHEFVHYYLYPRINGMYFADWQGAGNMPIWPVMKYYSLQEGMDRHEAPRAKRMYFENGSRQWITKLYNAAKAKFRIVLNAEASVRADAKGVTVCAQGKIERFDKVVLAQQAQDALRCMKAGLTPELAHFLSSFKYRADEVVAHTYYGVLPPTPRLGEHTTSSYVGILPALIYIRSRTSSTATRTTPAALDIVP